MTKQELKKVLKPLIKECIKDVLFEPGVLSSVIKEVVTGVSASSAEQPQRSMTVPPKQSKLDLSEMRKKMLESVNKDAYGGVDVFEGVEPLTSGGTPNPKIEQHQAATNPLSGISPSDAGVDLSFFKNLKK